MTLKQTIKVTDDLCARLIRIGYNGSHHVYTDTDGELYHSYIFGAMVNRPTKETFIKSKFSKRDLTHMIEIII